QGLDLRPAQEALQAPVVRGAVVELLDVALPASATGPLPVREDVSRSGAEDDDVMVRPPPGGRRLQVKRRAERSSAAPLPVGPLAVHGHVLLDCLLRGAAVSAEPDPRAGRHARLHRQLLERARESVTDPDSAADLAPEALVAPLPRCAPSEPV